MKGEDIWNHNAVNTNRIKESDNDYGIVTAYQQLAIYSPQDGNFYGYRPASKVFQDNIDNPDHEGIGTVIGIQNVMVRDRNGNIDYVPAEELWDATHNGSGYETVDQAGWREYNEEVARQEAERAKNAQLAASNSEEMPKDAMVQDYWPEQYQVTGNSSLFLEADFNLNPEVQQMVSYYDDMYLYADVAYENGIIDQWEYNALKKTCEENVVKLRQANKLDKEDDGFALDVILTIGGFTPYVGVIFDALSDPNTVYAATLDMSAIEKIADPSNFSTITNAIARNSKYNFKYTVYELYDDAGNVKYVGRTRQSLEARQKQHGKADPLKNGLDIREAEFQGKKLKGLSHSEARGLEHLVFESHGGFNNKNLLNKINPLDIDNPKVAKKASRYIDDAWEFLKKIK